MIPDKPSLKWQVSNVRVKLDYAIEEQISGMVKLGYTDEEIVTVISEAISTFSIEIGLIVSYAEQVRKGNHS